ncbi:alpha-galactosidase [Parageobacillus thermoglucosidasius]|uniref:alpha-galactosidase n=1 Tax=Parageobacillus thermoglucosidasius TaxID=1426 RepID=UPI000E146324|nr:alpha-galactosidase [Parageobacillus thermoglucosidasius]MED4905952.1 alpha-galactosidase [Parageobacillus thermoglucosidasius]MED4914575.1 alpha-galactosidase [Parageobacillus thermoglucosidasius]MED4947002.1 alpha-galactosidase [Parageobacillus thermoglucosidasius]MED4983156.1 alpha-galactosidase [Parageobacillus thermoglucosidasius]RDE23796.1 alpha-galactosidase [Parageobacillus thermoglucosidasius]
MAIVFHPANKTFHLQANDTSYVMQIVRSGYLAHLYWGKKVRHYRESNPLQFFDRGFSPNPDPSDRTFSLDTLPQEYPAYGNTDFRTPAYQVQLENGSTISDLRYKTHRIYKGKPKLEGLPATYVENENEAETLEIILEDHVTGLHVTLFYTVYERWNVITRSVRFDNNGSERIKLLRALSMNVDFRDDHFDFLHLFGAHCRERYIERKPLFVGTQSVESRRGASSHQQNPFIALLRKNANEDEGIVYAFNFVYSGNFLAQVEVDQFHTTRVSMGINPFDFTWLLEPGESFQTPEVVMVYSDKGLNGMSQTFHQLYRTRLARGVYRERERPILINNWEATYFDFNEEKILHIAKTAAELGIELFVLDDGWFGKRDNDRSSLGDWFVNKQKLPNGLEGLAKSINQMGMQFGLWVEPEMVSVDSELYRKHPDWCIHVPNRPRSEGRNQLVLDYSRKEVCDYIIQVISDVLASAPISYVKWDMNRHMTEIGSAALPPERQRETAHRYILGLYRVMEEITSRFPHVLFESCSGGGGRFDPGMLYYMPQTWTSDNTDAVSRLKIQYGTSLVYPISAMGAHVSAVPNHQVHRMTSLEMRGHVAMSGNFGYELDLTKLSEEEKAIVKQQVAFYKDIRSLVQFGTFYRILSPFEGNETAWMFVSEDKSEAFVAYFRVLAEANAPLSFIRLKGLDPEKDYELIGSGEIYGGDELMYVGLNVPQRRGDFISVIWRLRAAR